MNEPGLLPSAKPEQHDSLWEKAPAWRSLVVWASVLTFIAVALPVLLPQSVDTDIPVNTLSPAPVVQPELRQSAPVPATPQVAAGTPVTLQPAQASPIVPSPAPVPAPPPAPVLVSAAPAASPAVAAPAPQAAPQTNVCPLVLPPSPKLIGRGVVMSFEDRATSLARIQLSQSQSGAKIDPDFIDNQRVTVQMANGDYRVLLVPKTMQVSVGDRVTMQSNYRNPSLPCNYVPNLIVADHGPAMDRVSPGAPVETASQ